MDAMDAMDAMNALDALGLAVLEKYFTPPGGLVCWVATSSDPIRMSYKVLTQPSVFFFATPWRSILFYRLQATDTQTGFQ